MKLSYNDQSNRVQFVMKFKQKNNVTDCIGAVYVENEIELSWSIEPSVICDENQIRQRCD